jgi:hypothetical protein
MMCVASHVTCFSSSLRAWADAYTMDILVLLEQAEWLLKTESDRQTVKGVIEPMVVQVATLRRHLAFSNA